MTNIRSQTLEECAMFIEDQIGPPLCGCITLEPSGMWASANCTCNRIREPIDKWCEIANLAARIRGLIAVPKQINE